MSVNTYLPPTLVTPGFLVISAISRTNPMVITIVDSLYNTYVVGQLVHLNVPASYKMVEANQMTGEILAIDGLNFTVSIDATNFSSFIAPNPSAIITPVQPATLGPAGSRNIYNTTQEPFKSLNNEGN